MKLSLFYSKFIRYHIPYPTHPARVGGFRRDHESRGWGRRERRGRRCRLGRWGRGRRKAIDDSFVLGGFEDATQEGMLPPKGEEESGTAFIESTSRLEHVVRGGEARGEVCDGRAVGREGVELRAASLLNFGDAPVRRVCRAQGHDILVIFAVVFGT
jgi:hypothetical protein